MANTTFKGPVRSQNGFQQLVDGVWAPVAGGTTLIPYTSGNSSYTVTGLTTPGDSATFIWEIHQANGNDDLSITVDPISGTDGSYFISTKIRPNQGVITIENANIISVGDGSAWSAKINVTYSGNLTITGDLYAMFMVEIVNFAP